jgi:hypothetical protein
MDELIDLMQLHPTNWQQLLHYVDVLVIWQLVQNFYDNYTLHQYSTVIFWAQNMAKNWQKPHVMRMYENINERDTKSTTIFHFRRRSLVFMWYIHQKFWVDLVFLVAHTHLLCIDRNFLNKVFETGRILNGTVFIVKYTNNKIETILTIFVTFTTRPQKNTFQISADHIFVRWPLIKSHSGQFFSNSAYL